MHSLACIAGGWDDICCGAVSHNGIIQSPVVVHFLPHIIVLPLYLIVHPILLISTSHPALHRVTMETRECEARVGRMCAIRALCGSPSMASSQVWVEQMRSPFGSVAWIGVLVGCLFMLGAVVVRKWLLAPESTMAHWCTVWAVSVIVSRIDGVAIELNVVVVELITDVLLLFK